MCVHREYLQNCRSRSGKNGGVFDNPIAFLCQIRVVFIKFLRFYGIFYEVRLYHLTFLRLAFTTTPVVVIVHTVV